MTSRFSFGADLPEWARDAVHSDTEVRLSLTDRLRVLVLGRFEMKVVVYTENLVGRTSGESMFVPPRFRFPRKRIVGYVMEEEEPASTAQGDEG